MTHWKKKLLNLWLIRTLMTVLTIGIFAACLWFLSPRWEDDFNLVFLSALFTFCVMLQLATPIVKLWMWLDRPKPIRIN